MGGRATATAASLGTHEDPSLSMVFPITNSITDL
jgi:hypothetical protein